MPQDRIRHAVEKVDQVPEDMLELLGISDLCSLAVCGPGGPHCCLMACAATPDGRVVHLATSRHTRKFEAMTHEPRVSLLMDTRIRDVPANRAGAMALTVYGTARVAQGSERTEILTRLAEARPFLSALAAREDTEAVAVAVTGLTMLHGVEDARRVVLRQREK